MTIHQEASKGFSAGAEAYARGRPDYAPEAEVWLREDLGLAPGKVAVELGAGTGKFLPRLLATGATVIAVEPVAAMRDELRKRYPDVPSKPGRADDIPLADGSADAVVCAQSFHWFATKAALAEIRRVLRPGGALGLIWNVRDESVGWVAALTEIMSPYEGDTPRQPSGAWRKVFPAEGFSALTERHFRNVHTGPAERVILDRVLSVSFMAALPAAEQERVAEEIRTLIARTPELAGHQAVTFPYDTAAFSCRRTG